MDRLTHISVTNGVKELNALKLLILSERFSYAQVADWIAEVVWNLEHIFQRRRYDSDEFQCLLQKFIQETKKEENQRLQDGTEEGEDG